MGIQFKTVLVLAFILRSALSFGQPPDHVTYGEFHVGFRSMLELDFTRPSRTKYGIGRAVQINTWYPTKETEGRPMTFSDYVCLGSQEDSIVNTVDKGPVVELYLSELAPRGVDLNSWRKFLGASIPMKAILNARFIDENLPVALLIHASAANHSFMGEFLASHGMIVISVPYKGYLQNAFDVNVIGMETEIRDHEYALSVVSKMFNLQPKKIGVVGVSFGGQSAVGLAVRNKAVKSVVSLDGGIGSPTGPQLLSQFPFFSFEKLNAPLLHLYNPADKGGNLTWFDAAGYTDRYVIGFEHMDHSFFIAYGALDSKINHVIGPSKPKAGDNYAAILAYTYTFLTQAFLNGVSDPDKILNLDLQQTWITPNLAGKNFMKKKWTPVPLDELMKILTSHGVDAVTARRDEQKTKTSMPISDGSYKALITNRLNVPDLAGMKLLIQVYEEDFPASALAKYFKGRAFMMANDPETAKISFRQCIDLLPADATLSGIEKETYKNRCESFLK